ncbi:hypothetical protein DERP_003264 [Dermatophagoides pteronyssinus]|uniref:Uncharacterized protein n=1 Tax=Dermatophagoides pteronyssinus TaxID=6956 RepID=A0ABQ8JIZ7_DERPT|nr:hypothetical protein DERP_003264 [Dermatophagoides pteronyssinus]
MRKPVGSRIFRMTESLRNFIMYDNHHKAHHCIFSFEKIMGDKKPFYFLTESIDDGDDDGKPERHFTSDNDNNNYGPKIL